MVQSAAGYGRDQRNGRSGNCTTSRYEPLARETRAWARSRCRSRSWATTPMHLLRIGFARYRMIHTYRDMNAPGGRWLAVQAAATAVLFPVGWIALNVFVGPGFALTWEDVLFHGPVFVLPPLFMFLVYRHDSRVSCKEIRLDDHGMCELETRHRLIRLHVNEITAVKYQRDSEGGTGSYDIRYAGGKLGEGGDDELFGLPGATERGQPCRQRDGRAGRPLGAASAKGTVREFRSERALSLSHRLPPRLGVTEDAHRVAVLR